MRTSRLSSKNHWIGVGRGAAKLGLTLEAALTKNAKINEWISEGYARG